MFLEVNIQLALTMKFTTSVLDTGSGKYTVQGRNQNQSKNSRYCQTTDNGNRHRTPHFRTLSATDSHLSSSIPDADGSCRMSPQS